MKCHVIIINTKSEGETSRSASKCLNVQEPCSRCPTSLSQGLGGWRGTISLQCWGSKSEYKSSLIILRITIILWTLNQAMSSKCVNASLDALWVHWVQHKVNQTPSKKNSKFQHMGVLYSANHHLESSNCPMLSSRGATHIYKVITAL